VEGGDTEPAKVRWLMQDGLYPDHQTEFLADYYRPGEPSPLSDIFVGSVTRTLAEAMSRELAIVYQQINLAYQAGFIDSAEGTSLDFVVAILGVTRLTADYALGTVTFFRAPNVPGSITIGAGVRLMTDDGQVQFETTTLRTLQPGQNRVNVPVRAMVGGADGIVPANKITQILLPIAGIERVTNLDPTQKATADESDEALRRRAKARLRGLNLCTLAAIEQAARQARAQDVEIRDPQYPPDDPAKWTPAGKVQVLLKGDPDLFEAVRGAIEGVRAAGVQVQVIARLVYLKPRLRIQLDAPITPAGQVQLKLEIIDAVAGYVQGLSSGEAIAGQELRGAVASALGVPVAQVTDYAELRDVMVWLLDPSEPDQRAPRRDLIVHDGERATDEQIQAWEFGVLTEVEGGKALPILDFSVDDVEWMA
jgi:phage-related baseplate assembly protein